MHGLTAVATTSPSSSGYTIPMELDPTFQKVEGLWFDDGNLILQAENSLFRIYRGLLCARSSVFGDMFAFPPPAEGNQTINGCPIIQTYDSAQDMTFFLKALLSSEFFEPPPAKTTMEIVEGVLRLATKYDVRHLRVRAMQHLLTTYPTTLQGWKERDNIRTIPSVENTPFVVLNLAREFDMPWLIPSVAYCISSHDIHKTLDGADWGGKTQARGYSPHVHHISSSSSSSSSSVASPSSSSRESGKTPDNLVNLTWADQRMCIIGRNNILLKQNAHALNISRGFRRNSQSPAALTAAAAMVAGAGGAVPIPIAAGNQNQPQVQAPGGAAPPPIPPLPVPVFVPAGGVTTPNGGPVNPIIAGQPGAPAQPNAPNAFFPNIPGAPAPAPGAGANAVPINAGAVPLVPTPNAAAAETKCKSEDNCAYTRHRCAETLTRWGTAGLLDFFDEQQPAFAPGFCDVCLKKFGDQCRRASEDMWETLPGMFGLVDWEDLEKERVRVMGKDGEASA